MRKLATFFSLVTFLFLGGCSSNLSKNNVREGEFIVKNGTAGDKVWQDSLIFKRVSWYHELTLQFDLMLATISPQSGFNFWFSGVELEDVNKCPDFRIAAVYSLDTKIFPYSTLNEQLELAGFKKIDLLTFKRHFFGHPDSEMNSLRLYQLYGICRSNQEAKPLILNFPGFTAKTLN